MIEKFCLKQIFIRLSTTNALKKQQLVKDQKLQEIADAKQFGFVKYKEPVKFKKTQCS